MSNKFTRNITNIKNVFKQGLETNNQNDLLSQTDGNVFVRTLKHYHNLTDNIKNINGNIVTMNGGNKIVLPIITSVNQYDIEKKHYIKVDVAGDVSQDFAVTKGRNSDYVKGEYDLENNLTSFVIEVVSVSYYNQISIGVILPPENEGDGEGFKPLYAIDTLYMNATDYNVTDKLSPKYLLGRELIATKLELKKVKEDLEKEIEKKNPPKVINANLVYSNYDKCFMTDIVYLVDDTYKIKILKGDSVLVDESITISGATSKKPLRYSYPFGKLITADVNPKDMYLVLITDSEGNVVYSNSQNLMNMIEPN